MKKPGSAIKSARKPIARDLKKAASGSRSGVSLRPIVDAIHGVERAVRLLPSSHKRDSQDEALLKFLGGLAELVQAYCLEEKEPFDVMDPYVQP